MKKLQSIISQKCRTCKECLDILGFTYDEVSYLGKYKGYTNIKCKCGVDDSVVLANNSIVCRECHKQINDLHILIDDEHLKLKCKTNKNGDYKCFIAIDPNKKKKGN